MTAPVPSVSDCTLIPDLLGASRPAGWAELRKAAESALQHQDLPTAKDEDWKYSDLRNLKALAFAPGRPETVDIKGSILPEARGTRLVFVNGHFDPHHSCTSALPQGVRLLHLSSASEAAPQLGSLSQTGDSDIFANLNSARFLDGAYVFVPKHVKVESPLHLLFMSHASGAATVSQPRIIVVVEPGAEVELIEEYTGNGTYFTNSCVEIFVGENAELRHERIQRESTGAFHISNLRAKISRDGRYHSRTISFGASFSRQAPQISIQGTGADVVLDGLALLNGNQFADTHSILDHTQPDCTSHQLHKAIVDDEARAVFNGRIFVRKGAQGTDARQQSRNLLLSEKARVDTKPQLEIDTDDVKCAHGAAIGQLDPEELFYLQSRGLNDQAARNLLTYGFAADLLAHIPVTSLRRQLRQAVMARTNATDLASDLGEMA
ncbi:MAG: Fe-S cluster assembly protein SufD [Holophagaceae bacterium]|nr:Fe-S cluster assembly protein SufD [Holophagaceae bacterium]